MTGPFRELCTCGHRRGDHGLISTEFGGRCYWQENPPITYCRCDGFNPAAYIIREEDDWDALVI